MQDDWNFGHAGRIGYLGAIRVAELVDYRNGEWNIESVLRGLPSTKIYWKKVRKTWVTLEELLEVVGRYFPRYESVLKSCQSQGVSKLRANCEQLATW